MNMRIVKGISLGMISTVCWGTFYPVSRLLFGTEETGVDAMNFSALRFVLAALSLSPLFLSRGNRAKAADMLRHHLPLVLGLSLIGIVGEGLFVFWALEYTTAARASLMANASPIWTLLMSYFATHEALTRNKVTGMLLGMVGIVLAFLGHGNDVFTQDAATVAGDLMALFSGICWAYYTVYGERVSRLYGGLLSCEILFIVGSLVLCGIAFAKNGCLQFDLSWRSWAGVFYLGVISYGLANSIWYVAMKYVTPGELGSLGYVSAMLALTLSVVFLDERMSWIFAAAIALVLGGVWLMLHEGKRREQA